MTNQYDKNKNVIYRRIIKQDKHAWIEIPYLMAIKYKDRVVKVTVEKDD